MSTSGFSMSLSIPPHLISEMEAVDSTGEPDQDSLPGHISCYFDRVAQFTCRLTKIHAIPFFPISSPDAAMAGAARGVPASVTASAFDEVQLWVVRGLSVLSTCLIIASLFFTLFVHINFALLVFI